MDRRARFGLLAAALWWGSLTAVGCWQVGPSPLEAAASTRHVGLLLLDRPSSDNLDAVLNFLKDEEVPARAHAAYALGEVASGERAGTSKRQYWVRQNGQWKIFYEGAI